MPTEPLIVNLDNNVVVGLATDDVARDFVRDIRRNTGAKIMLSPCIIMEIARTQSTTRRKKLIDAAIEYCDGFVSVPFVDLLRMEVEAMNEGREVFRLQIQPIGDLRKLEDDDSAAKTAGPFDAGVFRRMAINGFDETRADLKDEIEQFKDFNEVLEYWTPLIVEMLLTPLTAIPGFPTLKMPREALVQTNNCGLFVAAYLYVANMYRQSRVPEMNRRPNGEGCLSDVPNLIEVAHSDRFLTRDNELYECSLLVRKALPDLKLEIVKVPPPKDPKRR